MKISQYLLTTQKNDPAGVEIASHRLMLKSGMIRQLAAGIYDILPLGLKSFRKVEAIVRQEMDSAGALEVSLPFVQPEQLWQETNRWDGNGKELLRFKDRHGRGFCLGPTHEEVVTDLVRGHIKSYKGLPITLYQIQLKFRDEIRPRFGLMRGREFVMKDAYSFSATQESLDQCYEQMRQAYHKIFERCGLKFRAVAADSGNIGGSTSEEFMVLADSGEDWVVTTSDGSFAANIEKAQSREFLDQLPKETFTQLEKKHTPGAKTIEDVADVLGLHKKETLKTLIYKADETFVALVLPGDRELNMLALPNILQADQVEPASALEVKSLTDVPFGSLGVINFQDTVKGVERIVFDTLVHEGRHYCMGANEKDYHLVGAQAGTDFIMAERACLHLAMAGDKHLEKEDVLLMSKGIEVGHVFKLGTKYSQAMNAFFLNAQGKQDPFMMGCYGIGIGRTLAAAIEQHHDAQGMILPPQLAPFEVAVVVIKAKDKQQSDMGHKIYETLGSQGWDVVLDDRDVGAGVKFKDMDLIGVPMCITVGKRSLESNSWEVKLRWEETKDEVSPEKFNDWANQAFTQKWKGWTKK